MRARRVTIMLGIVAISALTLFLITLLDTDARGAVPGGAQAIPDTLTLFEETILIGPDGNSAVEIAVVIGKGGSGDLHLPFDFDAADDFTILSGPARFQADDAGIPAPVVRVLGRNVLNLETTSGASAGDTVRVSAQLPGWYEADAARKPFGEYGLASGFVNYSRFVLRDFRQNLVLPPGMVVHSVSRVFPEYDAKKNPRPPFHFASRGDRVQAGITVRDLGPADPVRLELNIRPARRGRVPLVLGLIAAILYLIFYRDVLKPKEAE